MDIRGSERKKVKHIIVLASGQGSNFQALIDACYQQDIQAKILALVTNNPNACAIEKARKHSIPVHVINSNEYKSSAYHTKLFSIIQSYTPDLIVLAGYMKIVDAALVAQYEHQIINIHPSLLPAFQGLHAQKQAL